MTVTEMKKDKRPEHYELKAMRTRVYRALYGNAEGSDPQGLPELNDRRRLEEGWNYASANAIFQQLAEKTEIRNGEQVLVSNGLFPPSRYRELAHRLDTLRRFKAKGGQV